MQAEAKSLVDGAVGVGGGIVTLKIWIYFNLVFRFLDLISMCLCDGSWGSFHITPSNSGTSEVCWEFSSILTDIIYLQIVSDCTVWGATRRPPNPTHHSPTSNASHKPNCCLCFWQTSYTLQCRMSIPSPGCYRYLTKWLVSNNLLLGFNKYARAPHRTQRNMLLPRSPVYYKGYNRGIARWKRHKAKYGEKVRSFYTLSRHSMSPHTFPCVHQLQILQIPSF